jgi:hypothetical protein
VQSGVLVDTDQRWSLLKALLQGLNFFLTLPSGSSLLIFLPNQLVLPYLTDLSIKSPFLSFASFFTSSLFSFLDLSPERSVELQLFKESWSCLQGREELAHLLEMVQLALVVDPPIPLSTLAYHLWATDLASSDLPHTPGHKAWRACPPTPSNHPPPFVQGLLSHKNRHLFTLGLQLLSQHAFFANYSDQFRPLAGDNTYCPCNDVPFTPLLSPLHSGPPMPPPIHCYSIAHVLWDCRLFSKHRNITITGFSPQYLFSTEDEGRHVAQFLFLTQQGLRPLPPRPDPP